MRLRPRLVRPFALTITLALTALGVTLALASAPGCMNHDCEISASATPYGAGVKEGDFIDPMYWESTSLNGDWLDFHGGAVYAFEVPRWVKEGRTIIEAHGYVSPAPSPNRSGDSWTEGVGNIVEFTKLAPGRVTVTNTTCTQFYLRLLLRAGPLASTADGGDAGDASNSDADAGDASNSNGDAGDADAGDAISD